MDIFVVDNDRQLQKVNQVRVSGVRGVWDAVGKRTDTGTRPSRQHKGDSFAQRDSRGIRDKHRRQRMREKGLGICPGGQRTASGQTGDTHGQ